MVYRLGQLAAPGKLVLKWPRSHRVGLLLLSQTKHYAHYLPPPGSSWRSQVEEAGKKTGLLKVTWRSKDPASSYRTSRCLGF